MTGTASDTPTPSMVGVAVDGARSHLDVIARRVDVMADDLRDLPWRRTRDPWAILVAETMLQQTQVSRVIGRWESFLARWPDPAGCAAATVGAVIEEWAGLGYNRRAVNLHATARLVAADHDNRVPADVAVLRSLPGVGAYTARAVAVFAHERVAGVVDANVARVLARAVAGRSLSAGALQEVADDLVPARTPWRHNQAIMELGALTCTKRAPRCGDCCLVDVCAWQAVGGGDPAEETAGVANRQSRFVGSDRQGRGRLVAALRRGPVAMAGVATLVGWDDPDRVVAMVDGVVDDGLAVRDGDRLHLPG